MSKFNLDRRQFITAGGLTAATAALTLAGCGGSSDSGESDAGTSDGGEKKSGYKVAMIMSGIITDGGWDQGHYESLKRACARAAWPSCSWALPARWRRCAPQAVPQTVPLLSPAAGP